MKGALLLLSVAALAQNAPIEGNPKSPVRVVIYEDLACSDCALFRKMMDEKLLPKYGSKVAFEHRDFPLAKHPWAKPAAIAGRYFDSIRPALAVEWRRYALANHPTVTLDAFPDFLVSFALKHKLDPDKTKAALTNPQFVKLVEDDSADGVARGIARTPTVLVNGDPFIETFTYEEIAKSIDAHLAATGGAK